MSARRLFMFDLSLEDRDLAADATVVPATSDPEPEPPPPPVFGEAELAAARAEGFAAGVAQGRAEQRDADDHAASTALSALAETLAHGLAQMTEAQAGATAAAAGLCAAAMRKVLPSAARRAGDEEIVELFRQSIESLADEPRVVVRVPDAQLDALGDRLKQAAARAGFPGRLILIGEPSLPEGDCRIEWADGGVGRDTARLAAAVAEAVDRILAAPTPAAAPDPFPATADTRGSDTY